MRSNAEFDYIIVGAGTSGVILASRLSENSSVQVCLIEAGPDYETDSCTPGEVLRSYGSSNGLIGAETHDWGYTACATSERHIRMPRGRLVGGSSAINGQIFLRAEPTDFDAWALAGLPEWSFSRVLPYFKRSERDIDFKAPYHGQDGPIPVRRVPSSQWTEDQIALFESARALGFGESANLNAPGSTGAGPCPLNDDELGCRASTSRVYLGPARGRRNLTILSRTNVERLLIEGTKVLGVVIQAEDDERSKEVYAHQTIVCAGAIATPHLLMRSGIGPADHLISLGINPIVDHPGVGASLEDHPAVELITPLAETALPPQRVHPHQVVIKYTAESPVKDNDMILYGLVRRDLNAFVFRPTVNLALSTGRITLASQDPCAQPRLELNYLSAPEDMRRLVESVGICHELLRQSALAPLVDLRSAEWPLRNRADLESWLSRNVTTGYHPTSTCRMGAENDTGAVVNSSGLVYGLQGLRIADASIFPSNVRANIHATVVMLAEHIAEMISKEDAPALTNNAAMEAVDTAIA